jgi:serine/threonine-protein kinase
MLAGSGVQVPALRGLTIEAATTLLKGLGFDVKVGKEIESELEDGLVVKSNPAEGSRLAMGMTIKLYPSKQLLDTPVPDFLTTPTLQREAERQLQILGFTNIRLRCEIATASNDPLIGYVVSQYPAAGTPTPLSGYVRITVRQATCP